LTPGLIAFLIWKQGSLTLCLADLKCSVASSSSGHACVNNEVEFPAHRKKIAGYNDYNLQFLTEASSPTDEDLLKFSL